MKVLITGGKGYIATNIIANAPFRVGICDYETFLPPAHKLKREHLIEYDAVVHLAALSGIFACEESPEEACVDNILAAGNVFNLATELRIPVVFTSSQAAKDPNSSTYANMKWVCENLAKYFNNNCGNIYVVRLANVYGGYEYLTKKQTCVKQFITQFKQDKPLEVHGDGNQKRDFVHVFDVVEAIITILDKMPDIKHPIDIGTGIGTSIMDLVNMFPRKHNQHYKFEDSRNAGAESSVADTSLLEEIGFKCERKLEDYIKGEING